jgi:hypothetical protein
MGTTRECAWWGIAVAFSLGVAMVSLAWMTTLGMGWAIAPFVAIFIVAIACGGRALLILDELLKESKP